VVPQKALLSYTYKAFAFLLNNMPALNESWGLFLSYIILLLYLIVSNEKQND
jgi:hypothetical protein